MTIGIGEFYLAQQDGGLRAVAFPGGYPNSSLGGDADRVAKSYGGNAERLVKAKRHYDPDNVFSAAIPLPVSRDRP
jgi:hypothetical protein